jgi:TonB family protein
VPVLRPARDTTPAIDIAAPARKSAAARDTVPARFTYEVGVLERQPELMNKAAAQSMLSRYYPRMLEDAGIGGTTQVQFVITPEGIVDPSSIKVIATSHEQFAEASRKVVEAFEFRPGIYKGKPVRVMIQMPITWQPLMKAVADTVPREFRGIGVANTARQPKGFQELVPPKDAPPSTASASRITGRVVDRAGRPVAGASVVIQSLNLGAVTASDGRFMLAVPAGTHALSVLAPGWSSGVNRSVSVTTGQSQSVEVTAP